MAKSSNTQEMLTMIINNLSAFKQEVFKRFNEMDKKLDKKIDGVEERLTKSIDALVNNRQITHLPHNE